MKKLLFGSGRQTRDRCLFPDTVTIAIPECSVRDKKKPDVVVQCPIRWWCTCSIGAGVSDSSFVSVGPSLVSDIEYVINKYLLNDWRASTQEMSVGCSSQTMVYLPSPVTGKPGTFSVCGQGNQRVIRFSFNPIHYQHVLSMKCSENWLGVSWLFSSGCDGRSF